MGIISEKTVKLNVEVSSKEEAIRMAGQLLVDAGHVSAEYVDGMLAREETMSTYIGNGVAIPHGQFDNKENIHSTGISVVQVPAGIKWDEDEDELAYLVLGIAATADEHIGILSNLAEVLEDPDDAANLAQANDANEIIERLSRPQEENEPA